MYEHLLIKREEKYMLTKNKLILKLSRKKKKKKKGNIEKTALSFTTSHSLYINHTLFAESNNNLHRVRLSNLGFTFNQIFLVSFASIPFQIIFKIPVYSCL